MSHVIAIRALVKFAIRQPRRRPAGLTDAMPNDGGGNVARLPTDGSQAAAQVGIFPIEKVMFIEAAHLGERRAPGHHARARDPVAAVRAILLRLGHRPNAKKPRGDAELRTADKLGQGRRERVGGALANASTSALRGPEERLSRTCSRKMGPASE